MKLFAFLLLAAGLTACSSNVQHPTLAQSARASASSQPTSASLEEAIGGIRLTFDTEGNWIRITTSGSAEVADDSAAGKESAFMIASMRAKRTLAEFLNSDLKSKKSVERIARTYRRSIQDSESLETDGSAVEAEEASDNLSRTGRDRLAHRLASVLTERINDSSAAILRGVHLSQQHVQGDRMVVELTVSRTSIGAARNLSRMMGGMGQ